jgi:hypothetical protein
MDHFSRLVTTNKSVMAKAIQGTVWEYMGSPHLAATISTAAYGEELVKILKRAILRDSEGGA